MLKPQLHGRWQRMGKGHTYVDFLIESSQPAIKEKLPSQWSEFNENAKAVRYLGSLKEPGVKETLELALTSPNQQVVTYALVNLVFNQGGSQKAHAAKDFIFVVRRSGST